MDFTGKIVLITGAVSGMGTASAREFAALGAQVVIVDRDADLAKRIAAEIRADPPIVGDVSDSAFCQQVVKNVMEKQGRLDVLVNCAGIIVRADAQSTTDEQWHLIMSGMESGLMLSVPEKWIHRCSGRDVSVHSQPRICRNCLIQFRWAG